MGQHGLRIYRGEAGEVAQRNFSEVRLMVGNHPASVVSWTAEQWARLDRHPEDAMLGDNGVRVALRMA